MFSDVNNPKIFEYFKVISNIPRGSGNTFEIASFIENFAKSRGLFVIKDKANNVFVRKNATPGYENHPSVMLQGHTDMVCQANNDTVHDFTKDTIELIRNGDILTANGTTLGSDDGVSVAIMLALLDSDEYKHPTLECLFTSDEEIGMQGMFAFDASVVTADKMINIDSCDEGVATVSCAGAVRTEITADFTTEISEDCFYELNIGGLFGGHSGGNIHLGRTNAVVTLFRILRFISEKSNIRIAYINGGDKDNAITRECTAVFSTDNVSATESSFNQAIEMIKNELMDDDKAFCSELKKSSAKMPVVPFDCTNKLIYALSLVPYGPTRMSKEMPGAVETSSNFAVCKLSDGKLLTVSLSRSTIESALDEMEYKFESIASLLGGNANHYHRYGGWAYAPVSPLREQYLNSYKQLFGKEAKIECTHAGLECGIYMSKRPGTDIISIAPDIRNLHSPDETLSISSFDRTFDLVTNILENS